MTRYEFLNGLKKDAVSEDLITSLKKEKLPLILWGCGEVADSVYNYLKENKVAIDGVWADGAWGG